jgi:hypothetical protein
LWPRVTRAPVPLMYALAGENELDLEALRALRRMSEQGVAPLPSLGNILLDTLTDQTLSYPRPFGLAFAPTLPVVFS